MLHLITKFSEKYCQTHKHLLIILSLSVFFERISSIPVQDIADIDKDQRCLHINKTQRYSPSKYSKVPTDVNERRNYCLVDDYRLDIFTCNDGQTWLYTECLMCGRPFQETRGKSLCPNRLDDPERFLPCTVCMNDQANPCQNGGIAVCEEYTYAKDLKCSCTRGFTGKFCEYIVEETTRVCTCDIDDALDAVRCDENQFSTCYMGFNGKNCICNMSEDEEIGRLPRCEDIPVLSEQLLDSSAEGSSDVTDDKRSNIVLQSSSDDIDFGSNVPIPSRTQRLRIDSILMHK